MRNQGHGLGPLRFALRRCSVDAIDPGHGKGVDGLKPARRRFVVIEDRIGICAARLSARAVFASKAASWDDVPS
ncbi:hypothetical protein KOF26_16580 [Sphingomonas sp. XMGL2]|uniref:Uncharacterized protein n=1 Tax=Sphingomonas quercus TaxID=2842451 RepID=A0ABS6BMR0_9SPHN|nr:hypothetical protein [Sphingomonas quercus]